MSRKAPWLLLGVAFSLGAVALEPPEVRVRVSVKRILNSSGEAPSGPWALPAEIARALDRSNDALVASGSSWVLDLDEVVDVTDASEYSEIAVHDLTALEADAITDPVRFRWRTDAVNIYVVEEITNAGGACSFPAFGDHRQIICINSQGILGGSEGWLHEIGHYFNLIHTHEVDRVADTVQDTPLPSPFRCPDHDRNFIDSAVIEGYAPNDTYNVLHNIMGYHCDPRVLTAMQIIRMHRALVDYRSTVVEPVSLGPPNAIAIFPPEAPDGVVAFGGDPVELEIDGTASRDGLGGDHVRWTWTVIDGPPGGARFVTSTGGWNLGYSSFGYGDDDDFTVLSDMRDRYLTVYTTTRFDVEDPSALKWIEFDIVYEDGYVAYLNGVEVARRNLPANPTRFTPAIVSIEPMRELLDLGPFLNVLVPGANRLSIEVHNASFDSSDLTMHASLTGVDQADARVPLVASRAGWYYHKGSDGAPPSDWKESGFDPGASTATVELIAEGAYRLLMTVDQGQSEIPGGETTAQTAAIEVEISVGGSVFIRGDCNGDGIVGVSDAVTQVLRLFTVAIAVDCEEACDTNDDGASDISDVSFVLNYLFIGGDVMPPPYPGVGVDRDGDALGCER